MQLSPAPQNDAIREITWEDINDCSPRRKPALARLTDGQKVEVAIQRILDGQWIFFTNCQSYIPSPFTIELRNRVVTELNNQGHALIQQEDFEYLTTFDGKTKRCLNGVYVFLKEIATFGSET